MVRKYYSQRKVQQPSVSLDYLKEVIPQIYLELANKGYFYSSFGYDPDWGYNGGGEHSYDLEGYAYRKLRKKLWPIELNAKDYEEDDMFDMIEFLYDHVAAPMGKVSNLSYDTYSRERGREAFRDDVNEALADYGLGFELDQDGNIRSSPDPGMERLIQAGIPTPKGVDASISLRISNAIKKFRDKHTSLDDRKAVIVELASVFEELKKTKQLKGVLNGRDDGTIFELANKFYLRHADPEQVRNYDRDIWYSWMFYFYVSTLHATLRLIERKGEVAEAITKPQKSSDTDNWLQVLSEVRRRQNTLYGILRMTEVSIGPSLIELSFKFRFHQKRFEMPINRTILEQIVKEVFGEGYTIATKLVQSQPQAKN